MNLCFYEHIALLIQLVLFDHLHSKLSLVYINNDLLVVILGQHTHCSIRPATGVGDTHQE